MGKGMSCEESAIFCAYLAYIPQFGSDFFKVSMFTIIIAFLSQVKFLEFWYKIPPPTYLHLIFGIL
jgi:hypothetical protein